MEQAVAKMLARHLESNTAPENERQAKRDAMKLKRLQQEARRLKNWLTVNPEDRKGPKRRVSKSNLTDVAAVDEKHQIIVDAQAYGGGSEQGYSFRWSRP